MKLLVAIPCYNESSEIRNVLTKVRLDINDFPNALILVVDDGSTDDTATVAEQNCDVVIRHRSNRGLGNAFQTAVDYAISNRFDAMLTIDGDGQFDSRDIKKLVDPILDGTADMTTGSRFSAGGFGNGISRTKLIGNKILAKWISWLTHIQLKDVSCGFRCYSYNALLRLRRAPSFTYTQSTLLDMATHNVRIVQVPITAEYFRGRKSRVAANVFKYAFRTLRIIISSYRELNPLGFFRTLSIVSAVPAVIFSAIFLIHYLVTGLFRGFLFAGILGGFFWLITLTYAIVARISHSLRQMKLVQDEIHFELRKRVSE